MWAIPGMGKGACRVTRLQDWIDTTTTLRCKSDHPNVQHHNQIRGVEIKWIELMDALETMSFPQKRRISDLFHDGSEEVNESKTQVTRPYLREVILDLGGECPSRFRRMLPYLTQITALDLRTTYTDSCSIIEWIHQLPNLISLRVESHSSLRIQYLPLLPPATQRPAKHGPLVLQNLVLQFVLVTEDTLEGLLSMSPNLRIFKVLEVRGPASEAGQPDPLAFCRSRSKYFQHVHQMCPLLESYHFSIYPERVDDLSSLIETMSASNVSRWQFTADNFKSSAFQGLRGTVGQTLTDLEITFDRAGDCHEQLHGFLCHAPHLLHLRAHATKFPMEYFYEVPGSNMNLMAWGHSKLICRNSDREEWVAPSGRWACKNLRTLHLRLASSENWGMNSWNGSEAYKIMHRLAGNWTRNTLAYISFVCPKIQDLQLGYDMDLSEEGGLFLLSKLDRLEKLVLCSKTTSIESIGFKDLAWLARPSRLSEPWDMIRHKKLDLELLGAAVAGGLTLVLPQRSRQATAKRRIYRAFDPNEKRRIPPFDHKESSFDDDGDVLRHLQSSPLAIHEQRARNQEKLCWPKLIQFVVVLDPIMRVQSQPGCLKFTRLVNRLRPEVDFRMVPSGGWELDP
ncbi:hypothetical protein EMPS_00295 [Entomortierella parvispora]|uniref:F-box domain-containing protein n=1 Tax=Entomortierella parvispora TaxID=205924 RepID=A0A9P3H0B6_9FUNG|nr:hypothetical protein EMPS_00295 [Entomortierella parvispora]